MTTETRAQRTDARRNRERLLDSARRMFATRGADVPLEEVAKAASVSRTTLYRHFRTREDLAAAVLGENVLEIERRADELAGRSDGIIALFDFVFDQQRADRGLVQLLAGTDVAQLLPLSRRTIAAFIPLLEAGYRAGVVHPDVEIDDVMMAFPMAAGGIADAARVGESRDERVRSMLHRALWASGRS